MEAAKAEIRRLQRELANVEEEREILKKALLIFSRKNE
jgi:transposase-like protein